MLRVEKLEVVAININSQRFPLMTTFSYTERRTNH